MNQGKYHYIARVYNGRQVLACNKHPAEMRFITDDKEKVTCVFCLQALREGRV